MTVTDQLKIIDNKIKANQAQYDLDRLTAKISALSSGELRKYEYLTGDDLGYRPSVLEQTIFDDSHDKDDKKEGLLKRLKNIEKSRNINNNDKNKKTNDESELSSVKSESSTKMLIRDDELERSVYSPDVANMEAIETQTFYLTDYLKVFCLDYPDIFDSDLIEFLKNIASEEKNIY